MSISSRWSEGPAYELATDPSQAGAKGHKKKDCRFILQSGRLQGFGKQWLRNWLASFRGDDMVGACDFYARHGMEVCGAGALARFPGWFMPHLRRYEFERHFADTDDVEFGRCAAVRLAPRRING